MVNGLTRRPALAVGLSDRGLIAPGMKADINIVDYARLHLGPPDVTFDLPAGGRRIRQPVTGFDATIVNGQVSYRGGTPTGELPRRRVRANAIAT